MTPIFNLHQGQSHLIVSVPHAGTILPPHIAATLTPIGRNIVDTDWHVDKLVAFAASLGATLLTATHSRTVVDLNRSPAGGKLYPGQAETTICPTETFDGEPLYATAPPSAAETAERVKTYWQPYHDALAAELARIRSQHGNAILLDAHSIRSEIPRLFPGCLPDLNFGTNSGQAAQPDLAARALNATLPAGFSQVLDGRFRGGYITRHYGKPALSVQAIQIEIAQSAYIDPGDPPILDPARAAALIAALQDLVGELLGA